MRAYDPRSKKLLPYLDDLSMIEFVISPDRQWMAYSDYPSRHLWKSRLDGSEKVQLTNSYAADAAMVAGRQVVGIFGLA